MAEEKRKTAQEMATQRQERMAREGQRKGVELRRLTQEDILAEAKQTEIINRARPESPAAARGPRPRAPARLRARALLPQAPPSRRCSVSRRRSGAL